MSNFNHYLIQKLTEDKRVSALKVQKQLKQHLTKKKHFGNCNLCDDFLRHLASKFYLLREFGEGVKWGNGIKYPDLQILPALTRFLTELCLVANILQKNVGRSGKIFTNFYDHAGAFNEIEEIERRKSIFTGWPEVKSTESTIDIINKWQKLLHK